MCHQLSLHGLFQIQYLSHIFSDSRLIFSEIQYQTDPYSHLMTTFPFVRRENQPNQQIMGLYTQ